MSRRRPCALVVVVACAYASLACVAPAGAHAGTDPLERAIVRQINAVRAQHGLARVAPCRALARTASRHSAEQLRMRRMSHSSADGSSFAARIHRTIRAGTVGETIAWVSTSQVRAATIVRLWMASPPHRRQLLWPGYRRVGVGAGSARSGALAGTLVTADFASAT